MKSPAAPVAQLTPSAGGWRLRHAGTVREVASLAEALPLLPAKAPVHLALPAQTALLERLTLPATDREELAGMVELQLEKTLPYPVEEVASDFDVIHATETESTLLSISVHTEGLGALCQTLRDGERAPVKITLFAQHVAAACPADATVLAIWPEQGALVVAICENAKLSWTQIIHGTDADVLAAELPSLLLGAEMEGVPTQFSGVRLARDLEGVADAVRGALELPLDFLDLAAPLPVPATNLLPAAWIAESRREERAEGNRQRLVLAAVAYLLLIAGAFVYLAMVKRQVQGIDRKLAELQPQIDATRARQTRWQALMPAVDPTRSMVEILFLVNRNRPSDEVRITVFDHTPEVPLTKAERGPAQWTVEGEAPSANLAIEFAEKLRAEKELGDFRIDAGPPKILPNEHAHFSISGKL